MDSIRMTSIRWRGMDAWSLSTDSLQIIVTEIGGHLAAVRTTGEELNPLWQPPWPACDPHGDKFDAAMYGPPAEASLLATIVGHNLCLDRFGGPWPGEKRPIHGEAGTAVWQFEQSDDSRVSLAAELPEAALSVRRTFTFNGDECTVTTDVKRISDSETPVEWAEHVTLGDPFLRNSRITAGVDAAWISSGDPPESWRFRGVGHEDEVDALEALNMPAPESERPTGDIIAARVTEGWFRADRSDLNRRLEYRWSANEFPWLCIWTQDRSRTGIPWNGRTRAKGLEFSTKPFPEGKPPESRATEFHGSTTTCPLVPGQTLSRSFTLKWTTLSG